MIEDKKTPEELPYTLKLQACPGHDREMVRILEANGSLYTVTHIDVFWDPKREPVLETYLKNGKTVTVELRIVEVK